MVGTKLCRTCQLEKPLEAFCKRIRSKDGYHYTCKSCTKIADRLYYEQNRDLIKTRSAKRQKEFVVEAREFQRQYRKSRPDIIKKYSKKWRENNRDKRNRDWAKRHALKLQAIPKWSNLEAVSLFYEEAQFCTEFFAYRFHVDHIVPLISDLVCGLHWEGNLQVIRGEENESKGNRFWPDMP